ncbi:TenA family protein [Longibaculum muris]|uniref:TenA family protein n=1 Tax=Longibaculum muris TaxID=1796628 RepID=UPI003AB53B89
MNFMEEILDHNIPIWEQCAATPFVLELQNGTLPFEKFKGYMIQDSIYLKNYARIYGKAIFHANTLREIQLYYSMLGFVNDTESAVRLNYLKQFDMTDDDIEFIAPLHENQNYIDFMFEIAAHGRNEEILMAVLPCMLSYSYIFRKLAADPKSRQSRYWDFIKDYADEQYAESCKSWCNFAEHKCSKSSGEDKKYLSDIFEKASLLELDFWRMAYRDEKMEENAK